MATVVPDIQFDRSSRHIQLRGFATLYFFSNSSPDKVIGGVYATPEEAQENAGPDCVAIERVFIGATIGTGLPADHPCHSRFLNL